MTNVKVKKVNSEGLEFDNGVTLESFHSQDCCEHHWLSFEHSEGDFAGLEFDISTDNFFKRVDGYGIELIPINGHPVRIPGYASNNGYYSSQLSLILKGEGFTREYDITECQKDKY